MARFFPGTVQRVPRGKKAFPAFPSFDYGCYPDVADVHGSLSRGRAMLGPCLGHARILRYLARRSVNEGKGSSQVDWV
jgi:hypothetical protein